MKMLLTDSGIQNQSIHNALVELLPKPIEECHALCIPTASYGIPQMGLHIGYQFITETSNTPMLGLGWKSMGVLELTALPSLPREFWIHQLREADVLLVNGGDTMYLGHWMRESGLLELLPELDIVWVGLSAGSVVMAPHIGKRFVHWPEEGADDVGLGLVDFAIFPHLGYPELPTHTMADAREWFAEMRVPGYVIDVQTAIKVVDGEVDVISEGTWEYFER